jgi:hypothetical protein
MNPLDDYCRPGHHCDNGQLLWQRKEDARQLWLDDGADGETPTYTQLKHWDRVYREHVTNCEQIKPAAPPGVTHRCDSSLTMRTCSLCGRRR